MSNDQLKIAAHEIKNNVPPLAQVKNVILLASGKGGVGKSTTSVNLAFALQSLGAKVGLLDADIYGPNQPTMLGIHQKPVLENEKTFLPNCRDGLQTMSMGYLVDEETPMVWRGPMISAAMLQMVQNTKWDKLDYLIVDLPPGTGDVQLTLAKKVPVTAAIIVTTPQDVALIDAKKAIAMFNKVDVPVLGVIENMSTHICSHCGFEEALFGRDGGERLAKEIHVSLLGRVPLNITVRESSDVGKPIALQKDHPIKKVYEEIAANMMSELAKRPKSYANKFGKIVVEK